MNRRVIPYDDFLIEGKREQQKIDELLDKGFSNLSDEEKELLKHLVGGGDLPKEDKDSPTLLKTKSGMLVTDDEGRVVTADKDDEEEPGKEFTTQKGKTRGVEKFKREVNLDARAYRNKDSEERFFYVLENIYDASGMTLYNWHIYRTGDGSKYPFGMFMDLESQKFGFYKRLKPDILWKELDYVWDYGLILDEDLYEDFMNFTSLYKTNQSSNSQILTTLRNRFAKLM